MIVYLWVILEFIIIIKYYSNIRNERHTVQCIRCTFQLLFIRAQKSYTHMWPKKSKAIKESCHCFDSKYCLFAVHSRSLEKLSLLWDKSSKYCCSPPSNKELLGKMDEWSTLKKWFSVGGSPGLVVKGDESCSRGHGFESWHCILDGHDIFHVGLLWKLYCLFEKTKNKPKRGLGRPNKNDFRNGANRFEQIIFSSPKLKYF